MKKINTKSKEFKLGIEDNDKCIACGKSETIKHKLAVCTTVKNIWKNLNTTAYEILITLPTFEALTKPVLENL